MPNDIIVYTDRNASLVDRRIDVPGRAATKTTAPGTVSSNSRKKNASVAIGEMAMMNLRGSMDRKLVQFIAAMLLILASSWMARPAAAAPPGCVLEHQTETRDVLVPDQPIRHEKRTCHRLGQCTDPQNNTDWLCGDWEPA
jgi:hypothetical protein